LQLQPGERSILAYFFNENDAAQATQALKQQGHDNVQLNQISLYPQKPRYGNRNSTLSSMVLGNEYNGSISSIMAADPSVSGMSGEAWPETFSYMITVITENNQIDEAINIIKENGGRV